MYGLWEGVLRQKAPVYRWLEDFRFDVEILCSDDNADTHGNSTIHVGLLGRVQPNEKLKVEAPPSQLLIGVEVKSADSIS